MLLLAQEQLSPTATSSSHRWSIFCGRVRPSLLGIQKCRMCDLLEWPCLATSLCALQRPSVSKGARSKRCRRNLTEQRIGDEGILLGFEDAAMRGLSWEAAKIQVGERNGLLDAGWHPANAWARGLLARAKSRFRKAKLDLRWEARLVSP